MKLLIICFAIIYSCDLGFCEENTTFSCRDIRVPALERIIHRECFKMADNKRDEFMQQLNETVYTNGNESSVQLWATQVCEYVPNVVSCFLEGYERIKPECQNFRIIKQNEIVYLMTREIISFLCADNGKTLVDISKNDGYQCLFYTERYEDCFDVLRSEAPGNKNEDEFELNPNFCGAFNKSKECFVDKSKDCPNQKIETIVAGVFSYAAAVVCDPPEIDSLLSS